MSDNKKEIRNTSYQVRSDKDSRKVEGYALLFGVSSDGLSFEEVIERGALDGVLEKSDVFALLNHDQSRGVLARSKHGKGSLTLELDEKGLRYSFEAPNSALGDELLENIRREEVDSSSFAFTVSEDAWEKREDGSWKRTIRKVGTLYDVSPVYGAAYSMTSVYLRGKERAEELISEKEKRNTDDQSYYYEELFNSLNV